MTFSLRASVAGLAGARQDQTEPVPGRRVQPAGHSFAAGVMYPSLGILLRPEWAARLISASTVIVTLNASWLNRLPLAAAIPVKTAPS